MAIPLGDSVHLSDDYAWWWLYVPHFVHSPFYCYAYAFGELLVLALLRRYDEEGEAFMPRYLDLVRAGGSNTPQGAARADRPRRLQPGLLGRRARRARGPGGRGESPWRGEARDLGSGMLEAP